MSNFAKYIEDFRSFDIKLVDIETSNKKIFKQVQEKYDIGTDIIELMDDLNGQLKKVYKGSLKFDFCLSGGKVIDEIKIHRKRLDGLKIRYFNLNSELGKAKTLVERNLKKGSK